ncbi:hypothetical protein EVAR_9611_1 [Eumeta japonica]|uniref:Uncharacterized protein n=1 Tax=Eumeta variegata TaxID=151549 RepID=A0A4C1TKI8_EUMVA|nr:hypothetical protein EVAR_9611_1 [Eumeta japonica]
MLSSVLVALHHAKSNLSAQMISNSTGRTTSSTGSAVVLIDLYVLVKSISDDLCPLNNILRATWIRTLTSSLYAIIRTSSGSVNKSSIKTFHRSTERYRYPSVASFQ